MPRRALVGFALLLSATAQAQPVPSGCESLVGVPPRMDVGFEEVYQRTMAQQCNFCHIGDDLGGFNIDPDFAYANLINIGSSTGAGMVRVRPFQPAESWLWIKVNCQQPGLGVRMPRNGPPYLSPTLQALIVDWILLGAPLFPDEDRILTARFEARF